MRLIVHRFLRSLYPLCFALFFAESPHHSAMIGKSSYFVHLLYIVYSLLVINSTFLIHLLFIFKSLVIHSLFIESSLVIHSKAIIST